MTLFNDTLDTVIQLRAFQLEHPTPAVGICQFAHPADTNDTIRQQFMSCSPESPELLDHIVQPAAGEERDQDQQRGHNRHAAERPLVHDAERLARAKRDQHGGRHVCYPRNGFSGRLSTMTESQPGALVLPGPLA